MPFFDFRTAAISPGTEEFKAGFGFAGANQASADPVLFQMETAGVKTLNLASGITVLTLAMCYRGAGPGFILTSQSAGNSSITIPTFASLGWTRDADDPKELAFIVRRVGTGPIFVNPVDGTVDIQFNDLDPQYLPQRGPPIMFITCGDDMWDAC